MEQHSRLDPYSRSRYDEQGIDSKIVIMGNSGVGKTSLLQRYTQNKFDPKNTTSTSGAFFVSKKVFVHGHKVRLQLWDTAGQERFRSMAPMYYRGANAALLLYDITNASSFQDLRGWLQELKKNCSPELIIYIVGSKTDLHRHRQVTSDFARLSLHNWFPPTSSSSLSVFPSSHSKPSAIRPPLSTNNEFSYIRPRFTSFPLASAESNGVGADPRTAGSNFATASKGSAMANKQESATRTRTSSLLAWSNGSAATAAAAAAEPPHSANGAAGDATSASAPSTAGSILGAGIRPGLSRFGTHLASGWGASATRHNNNSNNKEDRRARGSIEEEVVDEDGTLHGSDDVYGVARDVDAEREWGLRKGMELFEVSAKDDTGIQNLFDHLIGAIIEKRDKIEEQNRIRKRDSIMLNGAMRPAWSKQAEEEEARLRKEQGSTRTGWSCC